MKTIQLYLSDLKELLQSREFPMVRACLREISPIDLADGWDHFGGEDRNTIFRLCPRQRAIQLFEELDPEHQLELVNALQRTDAEKLLDELDPSQTSRMVRELPQPMMRQLVGIMKKGGQESVQRHLQFPPESVGALMRGRYVTVEPKWSARHAIEHIQLSTRLRHVEETHLDPLMVAGPDGRLEGLLPLKNLVVAPRDILVAELMDPSPITLSPEMDREEAVKLFERYKLKGSPVIDKGGRLLGIVLFRDIYGAARQEVEEDFAKMAGIQLHAAEESAFRQAAVRLPWLIITCVGGLGVSSVVKHFEATLSQIIALASFSPLIAGMGGNVGSQTATIVVRAMATGEVRPGQEAHLIGKEIGVGTMLGLFYGLVLAGASFLFYGSRYGIRFSFVIGTAMCFSITIASILASVEPFILRRFGTDPATATGPLISTITDLLSNLLYFAMATYLLMR